MPALKAEISYTRYGIPIRNIWLLLLYASDFFNAYGHKLSEKEQAPDNPVDLIAEFLCFAVEKRLHQKLSHQYVNCSQVLNRVRGRVDLLKTESRGLLSQGKVWCSFEDLTLNTPRNCFIRGALQHLSRLTEKSKLGKECKTLSDKLRSYGVIGRSPHPREMRNEQFGRHDKHDQQVVLMAKLAYEFNIPNEQSGINASYDIDKDEGWFRHLFEKAIAGFYEVVTAANSWNVSAGTKHEWPMENVSSGMLDIMPGMKTDIILNNKEVGRRIIIDTKFTKMLTKNQHGNDKLKTRYLYQLYAYLRTQESNDDPLSLNSEGLLLHPSVGCDMNEFAYIQGHKVQVSTVDLAADAHVIRRQLLDLINIKY